MSLSAEVCLLLLGQPYSAKDLSISSSLGANRNRTSAGELHYFWDAQPHL